jgi:hypothetical protein
MTYPWMAEGRDSAVFKAIVFPCLLQRPGVASSMMVISGRPISPADAGVYMRAGALRISSLITPSTPEAFGA